MMVSIASLIYKSIDYLEFVYRGILENTPKIEEGKAEFFFVANSPYPEVLAYLKDNNIPHYVYSTKPQPPYPQNLPEIYKAWNYAVKRAKGEYVVLLNSDMYPCCSNWLEDMLKWYSDDKIITARLVESGRIPSVFPYTIVKNFGMSPEKFKPKKFQEFASKIKEHKLEPMGLFMPVLIKRKIFLKYGGYPTDPSRVPADQRFFYDILEPNGIRHYTAFDVIFYHIQEGEVRS